MSEARAGLVEVLSIVGVLLSCRVLHSTSHELLLTADGAVPGMMKNHAATGWFVRDKFKDQRFTFRPFFMPSSDTQAQIRATLDARADAIRNKDAQGVLDHFAPESVQFLLAPPLQSDDAAGHELEEWFATWSGPIGYEMRGLTIATDDRVAYCHALGHYTGTKTGGEKPDVWFRETVCLRKLNERWLITHTHESVPFYMTAA